LLEESAFSFAAALLAGSITTAIALNATSFYERSTGPRRRGRGTARNALACDVAPAGDATGAWL